MDTDLVPNWRAFIHHCWRVAKVSLCELLPSLHSPICCSMSMNPSRYLDASRLTSGIKKLPRGESMNALYGAALQPRLRPFRRALPASFVASLQGTQSSSHKEAMEKLLCERVCISLTIRARASST